MLTSFATFRWLRIAAIRAGRSEGPLSAPFACHSEPGGVIVPECPLQCSGKIAFSEAEKVRNPPSVSIAANGPKLMIVLPTDAAASCAKSAIQQ